MTKKWAPLLKWVRKRSFGHQKVTVFVVCVSLYSSLFPKIKDMLVKNCPVQIRENTSSVIGCASIGRGIDTRCVSYAV